MLATSRHCSGLLAPQHYDALKVSVPSPSCNNFLVYDVLVVEMLQDPLDAGTIIGAEVDKDGWVIVRKPGTKCHPSICWSI